MHPRASFGAGKAMGSRCDPMGAGVSVTAVLRAGASALDAAFHADGPLLCFTIIHFGCGGMAGPYEWAAKLPSRVLFAQLIGVGVRPTRSSRPTQEASERRTRHLLFVSHE
ncbi:hypothetical protein TcCL_NonESM06725 [Trypanosoma cruzi]|nr:hypothetical protein TcCL_NonESM06725 [Trypanosoma cruzi]